MNNREFLRIWEIAVTSPHHFFSVTRSFCIDPSGDEGYLMQCLKITTGYFLIELIHSVTIPSLGKHERKAANLWSGFREQMSIKWVATKRRNVIGSFWRNLSFDWLILRDMGINYGTDERRVSERQQTSCRAGHQIKKLEKYLRKLHALSF